MSTLELNARIAELKAENAALTAKRAESKLKLGTTKNGELCATLTGAPGWPMRHTKAQWKAIVANVKAIDAYLTANDSKLVNA